MPFLFMIVTFPHHRFYTNAYIQICQIWVASIRTLNYPHGAQDPDSLLVIYNNMSVILLVNFCTVMLYKPALLQAESESMQNADKKNDSRLFSVIIMWQFLNFGWGFTFSFCYRRVYCALVYYTAVTTTYSKNTGGEFKEGARVVYATQSLANE